MIWRGYLPNRRTKEALCMLTLVTVFSWILYLETFSVSLAKKSRGNSSSWQEDEKSMTLRNIRNVCNNYGLSNANPNVNMTMIVDNRHKVLICLNYKAATTTLLWQMAVVAGLVRSHAEIFKLPLDGRRREVFKTLQTDAPVDWVRKKVDEEGYFLASFVRHPFDRLVSVFENKINCPDFKKSEYFRRLSRNTRGNFAELAEFVVGVGRDLGCRPRSGAGGGANSNHSCDLTRAWFAPNNDGNVPNLWAHAYWRPVSANCNFCHLDYDYVGKAEHMAADLGRMLLQVGAVDRLDRLDLELRKNTSPRLDNRTSVYFGALPPAPRRRLAQLYRIDFDMFGYSFEEYM